MRARQIRRDMSGEEHGFPVVLENCGHLVGQLATEREIEVAVGSSMRSRSASCENASASASFILIPCESALKRLPSLRPKRPASWLKRPRSRG